jgi:hypothetical protein
MESSTNLLTVHCPLTTPTFFVLFFEDLADWLGMTVHASERD